MAGALSLQEDIWALVKKHSDTCLPEDLLARLAEDARMLACGERIRSLHRADPFGLFSEPREGEEEEEGEGEDVAEGKSSGGGEKAGAVVLPDDVTHMLEAMKINRLDKVAALNGFSVIDAEVEFPRAKKHATAAEKYSRRAPTLSSATIEAAAKAAVAEAGTASSQEEDEEEEDPEAPVFLTFRFRREPLPKVPEQGQDTGDGGGSGGSGEVINLAMDDEEEESSAVVATSNGVSGSGGGGGEGGGEGKTGRSSSVASNGDAKEGRKRAGSRGSDGESVGSGGGGGKTRKRAKSTGRVKGGAVEEEELEKLDQEEDGGEEEREADGGGGEGCQTGGYPDDAEAGTYKTGCYGDTNELEGIGLDYEPRTIVSYSISGGIGFKKPAEMLLQAVVYARGDGPACVMPPPRSGEKKDGGSGGGDSDDDRNEDDEDEEGSVSNDQEDVFDCNVDGPALAAIGRALGLYTGDEDEDLYPSYDEVGSGGGGGGKAEEAHKKKEKEKSLPSRLSAGSGADSAALEAGGSGPGGMTLSDLVWWLLMFPFFEKEFDMVEVVASSVFGEDDSDDSDDGGGGGSDESGDSGSEGSDGDVVLSG